MLKETEEAISIFCDILSLIACQLGGGADYAYERMCIRFKSSEDMRLMIELASLSGFSLRYHAPRKISDIPNHTAGFLPIDPGTLRKCV